MLFVENEFSGIDIGIENLTDIEVSGLRITTNASDEEHVIPVILPEQVYIIEKFPLEKSAMEDAMQIRYVDALGNEHVEVLIGYLDGVFSAEVFIQIVSINESGKIDLNIKVDY